MFETKKEMIDKEAEKPDSSHYQAGPKEIEIRDNKILEKSTLETIPLRNLADLDDVNISSPTNGQVLKYNSTSGKWENAAP